MFYSIKSYISVIYNITLPESIEVLEYTSRMSGREGVRLYKALHRTVQRVFKGDMAAMFAARDKVCEEFDKSER